MSVGDSREFDAWHELFDALCDRRGWYDNSYPASELCARFGKHERQDFEAAKKKLRAWRAGQRLPLRRNLATLGQLLDVESDPELEQRWLALYRLAITRNTGNPIQITSVAAQSAGKHRGWILACVALLLSSGAVLMTGADRSHLELAALPQVNFEGRVRVPVGASHLIHGALDGCKGPPPAWEEIAGALPATRHGTLSDGGLARKVLRRCGAEQVVRAVKFTGVEPGSTQLRLLGDSIKIDVVTSLSENAIERR